MMRHTQWYLVARGIYTWSAYSYVIMVPSTFTKPVPRIDEARQHPEAPAPFQAHVPHCTACGAAGQAEPGQHRTCRDCGHVDYVNPAPCVGVAILHPDDPKRVLLAKRAGPPKAGRWDFVGGFVEPGETVPEAARREVKEETGLALTGLRRLHQAAGWYTPEQPILAFLYVGEVARGTEPLARDDVAEVAWFTLDTLPDLAWTHEAEALQRLKPDLHTG